MKLSWTAFSGIRPQVDPRLLPNGNAQVADNVNTASGGLSPLEGPLEVMALPIAEVKTIYRFGQALASATQYWFAWNKYVDVVKGAIADDTSERTYWTGDGAPKYTTADIGTTGSPLPSASRPLGVPAPTTAPTLTAAGSGDASGLSETRVVIYTFVTDNGEESAPSPPATIDILIGQTVDISGMETAASNAAVLNTKRIYRAQAGAYLFASEIPAADATYSDTVATDALGEPCPSVGWDMPPASMTGLTGGPSGMMAAVDGYNVLFAEPFRPHAWPQAYAQAVAYPLVGLGQFGNSFIALTTGRPFVMTGAHPANMSVVPAGFYQPCVSKESIVSTGDDVIWASPTGFASMGQGGARELTAGIFTTAQWQALKPETIIGSWYEHRYVGSYDPGDGRHMFTFDPATQEWVDLPGLACTALYRDTVGDALYLSVGDHIQKYRGGADLSYTWQSQDVVTPLMSFAVARVTGSYPTTFKLYKDGTLAMTKSVTSDEPFKLPDANARLWSISVAGSEETLGVAIATTETEI